MRKTLCVFMFLILLFVFPILAEARAGGGGGTDSGGNTDSGYSSYDDYHRDTSYYPNSSYNRSPLNYVIGGLLTIFSVIMAFVSIFKNHFRYIKLRFLDSRNAYKNLGQIKSDSEKWDLKALNDRVREVFFAAQNCWTEGDLSIADGCLTNRIRTKWYFKLNNFKNKGQRNVLEQIQLKSAHLISVSDRNPSRVDFLIKGRMVDYMLDVNSNRVIDDKIPTPSTFYEVWEFVFDECQWKLNEIKQLHELHK